LVITHESGYVDTCDREFWPYGPWGYTPVFSIALDTSLCRTGIIASQLADPQSLLQIVLLGYERSLLERVDPTSVVLSGIAPISWEYRDGTGPLHQSWDNPCGCSSGEPDGFDDLYLTYPLGEAVDIQGEILRDTTLMLAVQGEVADWQPLESGVCLRVTPTPVAEPGIAETIPETWALYPNYPNPFNAGTVIRYDLPHASDVTLDIYNILGQRMATLVDGREEAGSHMVSWDGRSRTGRTVASGVYFYRLVANGQVAMKKMTLLR
jgi:hypothetical protein